MSNPLGSAWEDDAIEHTLWGCARRRMLEGLVGGTAWNVDLAEGRLDLGGKRFSIGILGTFAIEPQTFLWAWENPGAPGWAASLAPVSRLRELRYRPFSLRTFGPQVANPYALGHVAGELAGGFPLFVGGYEGGGVFLVVTDVKLDPGQIPVAWLPGVILQAAQYGIPTRSAVLRFLQRLGYGTTEVTYVITAERSDSTVNVSFDEVGRIADIKLSA